MGTNLQNTVTRMVRADEPLDEGPNAGALYLIFEFKLNDTLKLLIVTLPLKVL